MCQRPCNECPYTKDAIPGYFSGHDPIDYRAYISQDAVVACHTRSKFGNTGKAQKVVPCVGHIVAQMVSCKSPIRGTPLYDVHSKVRSHSDLEKWKVNALSIFTFDAHHSSDPRASFS